jgi:ParB family chromosome partitioning protein
MNDKISFILMERKLGKGLGALLSSIRKDEVVMIDVARIKSSIFQPRKNFDEKSLMELAESIKSKGVIEPLIVRVGRDGYYELICGERRLRASKIAGLTKVPAIIKDVSDDEAFEIALIENIQREDLTPVELALAFDKLSKMGYTHDDIGKKVGKSRTYVTNVLRILRLPDSVKKLVDEGGISLGHAKVLCSIEDEKIIEDIANEIVQKKLNVREVEKKVRELKSQRKSKDGDDTISQIVDREKLGIILSKINEFFPNASCDVKYKKKSVEIVIKFAN